MQASRLEKRVGGRRFELHDRMFVARVVDACLGSLSAINNGAWLDQDCDIEIENLIGWKMAHISTSNDFRFIP